MKKTTKFLSSIMMTAFVAAFVVLFWGSNAVKSSAAEIDENAQEIKFGDTLTTDLVGSSAAKWYKITLDENYIVNLSAESSTYEHGPGISVRDKNGSEQFSVPLLIKTKNSEQACLKAGTYYFKVSLAGGADTQANPVSIKFTFDKVSLITKKPTVKPVAGGKAKISWKKDSSVNGYQIQVSTTKDFSKNVKNYNVKSNKKTKTVSLPKKMRGKKIYVRVRAYSTKAGFKAYSEYSPVASKKSKK